MLVYNTVWADVKQRLQRVMKVMMKIWVPCPRNTDSNMPFLGGRKTSPCTCFQPDSSCASSCGGRKTASQKQSQSRKCLANDDKIG